MEVNFIALTGLGVLPMKPENKLKIGDTVIDARDLGHDEKVTFIEFAIHLAVPRIAQLLAGEVKTEEPKTAEHDNLLFEMPPTLTVQEVAEYLRVSPSKIYDMCRTYHGKYFPHFKVGNRFKIPRDKFIVWLNSGGLDYYQQGAATEDLKRQHKPVKQNKAEKVAKTIVKEKKLTGSLISTTFIDKKTSLFDKMEVTKLTLQTERCDYNYDTTQL